MKSAADQAQYPPIAYLYYAMPRRRLTSKTTQKDETKKTNKNNDVKKTIKDEKMKSSTLQDKTTQKDEMKTTNKKNDAKKTIKDKTRKSSMLKDAVAAGVVRKARRPFALYVLSVMKGVAGKSRAESRAMMSQLGHRWKTMQEEEKQPFKDESAKEFRDQKAQHQGCKLQAADPVEPAARRVALHLGGYRALDGKFGEGAYGTVVRVADTAGRVFVAKIFKEGASLKDELAVYEVVKQHPSFLSPCDHFCGDPLSWIVLPIVAGGSASDYLKRHPKMACNMLGPLTVQVAQGLDFMHRAQLVHLDIKPGNILWDSYQQKALVADFSLASKYPIGGLQAHAGCQYCTPAYRPPEVWEIHSLLTQEARADVMGPSVDVWSLGVTVYELCVGKTLFHAKNAKELRLVVVEFAQLRKQRRHDRRPWLQMLSPFRQIVWQALCPNWRSRMNGQCGQPTLAGSKAGLDWLAEFAALPDLAI